MCLSIYIYIYIYLYIYLWGATPAVKCPDKSHSKDKAKAAADCTPPTLHPTEKPCKNSQTM